MLTTEKTGLSVCATPSDTTAEAYTRQGEIYRQLGGSGRLQIMFRLNDTVRRLAMAGIRTRHPEYGDDEIRRAYYRLQLGDAIVRLIWPNDDLVNP